MTVFKIEGAKNSFALASLLDLDSTKNSNLKNMNKNDLAQCAIKICQHSELNVDGCVFILPSKKLDFAWEFFNSDGSEALMCGNAARAVSLWFNTFINAKKTISFFTPAQNVRAEIIDSTVMDKNTDLDILATGRVKVWLKKVKFVVNEMDFKIFDSGVPHLCVFLNVQEHKDRDFVELGVQFFEIAKSLRFPKSLDAKGTNVTYIWLDSSSTQKKPLVRAMSFERGIENWTEACGTGAMAAAYCVKEELNYQFPINVQMPGGLLEIGESNLEAEVTTTLLGPALISKTVDILI